PPQETISESSASSESSQTVVEEEPPPEVAPAESPTPQATETEPKTVVAPPPKPDPVDWLRDHQGRWPHELQLKEAMVFPVKRLGQVVGSVKAPAGMPVSLMTIQADTVMISY